MTTKSGESKRVAGSFHLGDHLRALLLSTVVTRIVKAPSVSLTTRKLDPPELVMVPTRHGDVRCAVTRPALEAPLARQGRLPPVHLNFHGGAFILGAARQDDHLARGIAGEVGAFVVNVDYSAGMRTRYPQAHEECFDVLQWVARSGAERGWDSSRISVSGTSAGGNLALGVLELARRADGPRVSAAALIVPAVDQTQPPEAAVAPPGSTFKPFVNAAMVRLVHNFYFADAARRSEPLASPGLAGPEQLASLPPLLVFSAERDSLRPLIERYVELVRSAAVDVTYRCMPGVDHGYTNQPGKDGIGALKETGALIAQFLIRHLV
jgi:acetyl esterase